MFFDSVEYANYLNTISLGTGELRDACFKYDLFCNQAHFLNPEDSRTLANRAVFDG